MNSEARGDVHVDLLVSACVNGASFSGRGFSRGRTGGGEILAEFAAESSVPQGFQLGLLPYVLVTGQPSLSRSHQGVDNPFERSRGEYVGIRTLDLGSAGSLRTEYEVVGIGESRLQASFRVTGSVQAPKLKRICPTVETWAPMREPGVIKGHFTLVWETCDGNFLKGEAETLYRLPVSRTLPSVTYRSICIDMEYDDLTLRQHEEIAIYPDSPLAFQLGQ